MCLKDVLGKVYFPSIVYVEGGYTREFAGEGWGESEKEQGKVKIHNDGILKMERNSFTCHLSILPFAILDI